MIEFLKTLFTGIFLVVCFFLIVFGISWGISIFPNSGLYIIRAFTVIGLLVISWHVGALIRGK
ncbi:hypothetical protein LCGC14_2926570 [marine sediment metagenome]|uniref:Uncharacterized protein n=1 Tax=marine sediment metagenome TaxID=412755 RepID=A0A0F8Y8Z7_9ZZZZ